MTLDKYLPSEWMNSIVVVSIKYDKRPPLIYEGRVIDKNAKNTRVLVMPVQANKYTVAKWIEADKVECLEIAN